MLVATVRRGGVMWPRQESQLRVDELHQRRSHTQPRNTGRGPVSVISDHRRHRHDADRSVLLLLTVADSPPQRLGDWRTVKHVLNNGYLRAHQQWHVQSSLARQLGDLSLLHRPLSLTEMSH